MATVLASNNNNSLNSSGLLVSFSGIYMLFLRFKRKCIYIIAYLGSNMEDKAQKILDKLERLLEWHSHEKDTPLYQEIRVLLRYYELYSREE